MIVVMSAAMAVFCSAASADTLFLSSGDRVSGSITGFDAGKFSIATDFAGTVKVPKDKVSGIRTDRPAAIVLSDGSAVTGRVEPQYGTGMIATIGRTGTSSPFAVADIAEFYPDGKIAKGGFKWSGRLNAGFSKTDGNTETKEIYLNGRAVGRAEEDRIKVDAEYNRETSFGAETEDNARLDLQHDHFVTEKAYFYTNAGVFRDDIANLNLRTTVGTGFGYQVFETEATFLSLEAGPAYINEDFETAEDDDSIAGRWAIRFEADVFGDFARFFHAHEGLFDVSRTSDYILRSETGFRVPVGENLNATAQVNYDFENEPPPQTKKSDTKFILSIGYNW